MFSEFCGQKDDTGIVPYSLGKGTPFFWGALSMFSGIKLTTSQGLPDQQYLEADKVVDVHELANSLIGSSSQYRGGGGRSFRRGGRGRGQFNRGRGRGVGSGRHFPSHSSGVAISDVPGASAGATYAVPGSSSVSAQVQTAPVQAPPHGVFCEICKIECNTSEVMQVHLKGKKHLKNIRLHEAKQRHGAINGSESSQIPTSQLNSTEQPMIAQESEDPTKNMSSEIAADNNNVGETSDVQAEEPDGLSIENSGARGRGLKRKLRGGKGRKQARTADGSNPEQAVAITCELCNVKCDTQRVYQAHISGKKHMKRAYGPQAVGNQALARVGPQASSEVGSQALAGVVGLQTLYPPDINALANAINAQVQQGDNDPQVLLAQLLVNALSQAQGSTAAPVNGSLAAQTPTPIAGAGSGYDPQLVQTQVSEVTAHAGVGNLPEESKNEILSVPLESNAHEGSNVGTQNEGGSSETK
ncbi:zinc finger RNA-binding protein-like [Trifolium pratense]|uniref:Zinc finger RNA-binding protein-like n=1 Tax=Trifolium pratense TaxID=57577 RepID=A0A2K3MRW8_TRIPR|nr:zinc finger RNA-binding protein-like [Trifolium pratense]